LNEEHGMKSRFFVVWRRRFFGAMRVAVYLWCATLLCAALAARVVYADFKESTLAIGRELDGLRDVLGEANTVTLNGAQMNVSTALTDQSPSDILDRFEAICAQHPGFVARALADIPATLQAKVEKTLPDRRLRLGIVRNDRGDSGALTCFADDRESGLLDLPMRLKAFARSQNLAEFGRFRYVYVHRANLGKTHVTSVWTDGEMNVGRMFPAQGDAAGFDSLAVPRPPESKRILSAGALQVPFGVHIYDSLAAPERLRAFYDTEMAARGWATVEPTAKGRATGTVLYVKDSGRMVYVTATPKGEHTLVTCAETARPDTVTEATISVVQ
jgi:hypothetical protein